MQREARCVGALGVREGVSKAASRIVPLINIKAFIQISKIKHTFVENRNKHINLCPQRGRDDGSSVQNDCFTEKNLIRGFKALFQ